MRQICIVPNVDISTNAIKEEGENSGEQKIVYDQVTDRSKGFAFIATESVQEAKEASRMFNGAVYACDQERSARIPSHKSRIKLNTCRASFNREIPSGILGVPHEMEMVEKKSRVTRLLKGYLMATLFYEPLTRKGFRLNEQRNELVDKAFVQISNDWVVRF
uniref:Aspartate carbamoyltransferase, chloroplastic-like n=1 Tax=Tanacetum cinerariifolium TaxID=118510 RepID=A0A6L2NIV4_TANCI|nr:aspartate carbamoyltransferase, chloroplastic-like [Tanacetum cinerariifolium]